MTETQQTSGRDLLRLTTAGSVDDGKSTLIGRLLADSGALGIDQITALAAQAVREGQEQIDYARITDGLTAEREQGITIDVAYRYFATPARSFILADVPGHEQYTRNMVTGASKATAALILTDARTGMTVQTRRHICIAALLGIRDIVFAVNKMDLVDWAAEAFADSQRQITNFIAPLGFRTAHFVPVSAKRGDNVVRASEQMPWHRGAPLIGVLEALPPSVPDAGGALRLPVQMALRPAEADAGDFRGYMGRIAQGSVRVGQRVTIMPGGRESTVTAILKPSGAARAATVSESITLTLADDIDAGRGYIICDAASPPRTGRGLDAALCWLDPKAQDPRGAYAIRIGTRTVAARITLPKKCLDVTTLATVPGNQPLTMNEIGLAHLQLQDDVAFDDYGACKATGAFIVIDTRTNDTAAAGMVGQALVTSG